MCSEDASAQDSKVTTIDHKRYHLLDSTNFQKKRKLHSLHNKDKKWDWYQCLTICPWSWSDVTHWSLPTENDSDTGRHLSDKLTLSSSSFYSFHRLVRSTTLHINEVSEIPQQFFSYITTDSWEYPLGRYVVLRGLHLFVSFTRTSDDISRYFVSDWREGGEGPISWNYLRKYSYNLILVSFQFSIHYCFDLFDESVHSSELDVRIAWSLLFQRIIIYPFISVQILESRDLNAHLREWEITYCTRTVVQCVFSWSRCLCLLASTFYTCNDERFLQYWKAEAELWSRREMRNILRKRLLDTCISSCDFVEIQVFFFLRVLEFLKE